MTEIVFLILFVLAIIIVPPIAAFRRMSTVSKRMDDLLRRVNHLETLVRELRSQRAQPQTPLSESAPIERPQPETVQSASEQLEIPVEDVGSPTEQSGPWAPKPRSDNWSGHIKKMGLDSDQQSPDAPEPEMKPAKPSTAFVFKPETKEKLTIWLKQNWFLAVAAISMALAGVFLVQYGIENGLITPFWRVVGAAVLGVILIVAGEVIRRKQGDEDALHAAHLASTFAGAGLVALYTATIAAQQLYHMIGAELAFAEMVGISLIAIVLGWLYGPFLTMFGILGAVVSPFIVGGTSDTPELFYYYFTIISFAGLLIDAKRRWAWVSVLGLIATHGAAWFIFSQGAGDIHYLAFALLTALGAILIPPFKLTPAHDGPGVLESLAFRHKSKEITEFPTRVAFGAFAASLAAVLFVALDNAGPIEMWAVVASLTALFLIACVWNQNAPALTDLVPLAPLGLLAVVYLQSQSYNSLFYAFITERAPESPFPKEVSILAFIALVMSWISFTRARQETRGKLIWTVSIALFLPAVLIAFEVFWRPAVQLGNGLWAAHPMIAAIAMTWFAERSLRDNAENKTIVGIYAISALSMIAFSLSLMFSQSALTLALAVLAVGTVALDRWQRLPLLGYFVKAVLAVIVWRLIADPGVPWAVEVPLWEFHFAFLPVILCLAGAWVVQKGIERPSLQAAIESTTVLLVAAYAALLLMRSLGSDDWETHWGLSLTAAFALIAMAGQLYRMNTADHFPQVYALMASIYAVSAGLMFGLVITAYNPLHGGEVIIGPLVFDSLLLALAPLAGILASIAWKFDFLHENYRKAAAAIAAFLALSYIGLEIRHFWRGDDLSVAGATDPELYSYTVAMLVISVILLFVAFSRRSAMLRRIAVFGVSLTIAKVFLIDTAGLAGLMRVASFLGLGLSLAGLAWINRVMTEQWDREKPSDED